MDREVQELPPSVLGWEWMFILSPSARTGLADLAPRAKVGQTVGCSTFTRGAKPATRRVADGERMNPQGKGGAFAPIQGDGEHQSDERPELDSSCNWRAINPGNERSLTVTRGHPDPQVRPCGRPEPNRFPS
jgi:hypothetical protein